MNAKGFSFAIIIISITSGVGHTQSSISRQREALDLITSTADRLCTVVETRGGAESSEVQGNIRAELNGLASRLVNSGVSGTGKITNNQYQGVLQSELAATLGRNADCKLRVFESLKNILLNVSSAPESSSPRQSIFARWAGSVICQNGRSFSVSFDVTGQIGETYTGLWQWSGSGSGRSTATLAPDPNSRDQSSYVLVPAQASAFRYTLTKSETGNLLQGQSLGRSGGGCQIRLDR